MTTKTSKDKAPTGICRICERRVRLASTGTDVGAVVEAHKYGKRGKKAPCPGSLHAPRPELVQVLTADVIRTLVPHVDYVRLTGFSDRQMFAVQGVGESAAKGGYLEVFGPLAADGKPVFAKGRRGTRQRIVLFGDVKAKVRNPPQ